MGDNLVIVESPAKAKTIEKILGSDYVVKSSFGHIRDLPKKGLGIDIANNFQPDYQVSADKKGVVSELKSLSKKAKNVWLASDEDREGESIAWHLSKELGLDEKSVNRIVFHEITATAINNAIKSPRTIDINLVNAQQARRVLDRLVGFELSPLLWRKVRPSLSAGRVQSVAVRLIVEREREIIAFESKSFYKVVGDFSILKDGVPHSIKTELASRFNTLEEATAFLEECKEASFSIASVENKPGKRSPSAPFTTSTLQQEASRKLGLSVSQTMRVAQKLYEEGHITYMRTDSLNLSKDAVSAMSGVITGEWGKEYLHTRHYTTSSKGAQEAHEAIRPTYASHKTVEGTPQEKKLYSLIWKRAVASQMADAQIERTVIQVKNTKNSHLFVAKGEVITFEGFLKAYDNKGEDTFLPPLTAGDVMTPDSVEAIERFELRPPRYSEASLVKQLEELMIGRPSTYAPTISTIINRGYVIKEDRIGTERSYNVVTLSWKDKKLKNEIKSETYGTEKSKLFPTDIGIIVTDYLLKHFASILDYNFTASVESEFDDIADGGLEWQKMLAKFYSGFHKIVVEAGEETGGYATSEQRLLGVDPKSGKNVYARMGRFGAMVQIGESEGEVKPKYAGLKPNMLIETVTLEDAIELFSLPRSVGEYEEKEIVIGEGRFGPYVRHNSAFVSIPKEFDPMTITESEAIALIEAKRKKDSEKVMRTFPEDEKLQILNGRWGAYIYYDEANYKAPVALRDKLAEISYQEIMEIVKTATPSSSTKSKAKPATKRSSAAKKPAVKRVATKATATKATATKRVATKATATKATATKRVATKATATKATATKATATKATATKEPKIIGTKTKVVAVKKAAKK